MIGKQRQKEGESRAIERDRKKQKVKERRGRERERETKKVSERERMGGERERQQGYLQNLRDMNYYEMKIAFTGIADSEFVLACNE